MIYLIPKCVYTKKDFIEKCFKYIDDVKKLDIIHNPKKSIFPRLKNTKKRGKAAIIEIIANISITHFSDEYHMMNDLINLLTWGLNKVEYKGVHVLVVKKTNKDIFTDKYFPLSEWSHIPESDIDLLNSKVDIMNNKLFEDNLEEVEKVKLITSYIDNYVLTDKVKFEIIKYIIKN